MVVEVPGAERADLTIELPADDPAGAALCGIVGYKPSYGHFPTAGMKANTEWLDTIGAYARSIDDIALFRAALMAIPWSGVRSPGSAAKWASG